MGYFFRPRFPNSDHLHDNKEVFLALAKIWDAPNNKYSFAGPVRKGKQFAMWRWWGYFIHSDLSPGSDAHYKDFINKLFIVVKDPTCDSDYDGRCIWRRKFNLVVDGWVQKKGDGFNKKYSDGFTLAECGEAFEELKQLIIDDKLQDWDEDKEFIANLKQSLKYIMFSKWEDYEAY